MKNQVATPAIAPPPTILVATVLGGKLDVGEDTGSAVDEAYTPPFRFEGEIKQVTVDLEAP